MTNKELANLIYPDINKDISYYENKYPLRKLKEGAIVSRFAPSPTGFVHMGSLLTTFIAQKVPKDTDGIFYIRIEDTDQKRSLENGIQGIIDDLKSFDISYDEGVISETESKGEYGPYIQSKRKEIYQTFVKYLIEKDLAYPCFCSEETLDNMRKQQEKQKDRLGYYGKWAICRSLSKEECAKRIINGDNYIIRLKSPGNFNKKIVVHDLVRGSIEFPENDLDVVLIKNDGLPIYHLAHIVDDYLMRTTHILRAEEWLSSTPIHLQLWQTFDFKPPKYAHLGLVMKIEDSGIRRKLSKRKDPEAAVSYYHEKGYPIYAIKQYLLTLANSNFEGWMDDNPDKLIEEFKIDFKKISKSGSLFDLEKIINISKNYISKLSALEVYNSLLTWALKFNSNYADLLIKYKDYSIAILNIEREGKKPRKDFACYSEIMDQIFYMYDELFLAEKYEWQAITNKNEIKNILDIYLIKYYDENDDKETWFKKIKDLCDELGYASNMKDYKLNPDKYKGNITDITTVIRVALTTKSMTPDLYEIMQLLKKDCIENRVSLAIKKSNY